MYNNVLFVSFRESEVSLERGDLLVLRENRDQLDKWDPRGQMEKG